MTKSFTARLMAATFAAFFTAPFAIAQSAQEIAEARQFFATYDNNRDGQLSKTEFVDGFIAQSRQDRPMQTALALTLYGEERIKNCLRLAFDRADSNVNGLMSLEELGTAYREDAFDDLREIC